MPVPVAPRPVAHWIASNAETGGEHPALIVDGQAISYAAFATRAAKAA